MLIKQTTFYEDSVNTLRARLDSENGSGTATGVRGEENWLEQADFSSITCKVFITDGATPTTPVSTPTVTVSSVIIDTPSTNWTEDTTGYNFSHALAETVFAEGGSNYLVEYKGTLTGGEVFHWGFKGICEKVAGG